MAYTYFGIMRQRNLAAYGVENSPAEPYLSKSEENEYDLKSAALRFIHNRCEGLKFNDQIEEQERKSNTFRGTSAKSGQIPFNMQMDINRLCLERRLESFIDSGVAEDAYDVYYCYLEMFFGCYGKSKKMVELLSEFEANGSSLLMKHRDHYSHSVYVFALGLAIYETNKHFRRTFKEHYGFSTDESDKDQDHKAANMFLEYWGLTALFHDIGYPFELPFEQSISYYEVEGEKRGEGKPYLAYCDMDKLVALSTAEQVHLRKLLGRTFSTTEELFAWCITEKLGAKYGFTEEYLLEKIHSKPVRPDTFGYFMDHAYFSAVRLYQEIVKDPDDPGKIKADIMDRNHLDALTAILLHNSLYKFAIAFYKIDDDPLPMDLHPLAYLLMLCDELQCWDRTAYGRNSRIELHPTDADFDFSNNAIKAIYHFDKSEQDRIDVYNHEYEEWVKNGSPKKEEPRLKDYSDMAAPAKRFIGDICRIVDTTGIPLYVTQDMEVVDRSNKHTYLSNSNFLHLFDFAVALNARYNHKGEEMTIPTKVLEGEFEKLSLEYQLSNINQAKSFGRYLNSLGCFFTDKPVDYDMVYEFIPNQMEIIGPMEHERWVREHIAMGWKTGSDYETLPLEKLPEAADEKAARAMVREQLRMHKLTMDGYPTEDEVFDHYAALPDSEKDKDVEPFNSMLKLIRRFDGLRIYHLNDEILRGASIGRISRRGLKMYVETVQEVQKQMKGKGKMTPEDYRMVLQRLLEKL